jgi:peroxiredoxin
MKRDIRIAFILGVFALLFTTPASSQSANAKTKSGGYEITVKVNGLKDSLCHLANYYGEKQYLKDSAYASSNGTVIFKGDTALAGGIYLFVFPNKTYFEMLVDKEQHFTMECDLGNVINTMKIKNSSDNSDFYTYLKFIQERSMEIEPLRHERKVKTDAKEPTDSLDAKIKKVDQQVISYKQNYIESHPGKFLSAILKGSQEPEIPEVPVLANGKKDSLFAYYYYKAHYFDNLDLADERLLRTPIYHNRLSSYLKNMVLQHPDSLIKETDILIQKAKPNRETFKYVVWYTTNTYETSNIMGLDEVFVFLVKKYYTKEDAYWVDDATLYKIQDRARILEPILIGKKAKNLVLTDSNNVARALYDVNAAYTLLLFWDPDCGHCKKEVPVVKAAYDKFRSKGVMVYAVCTEVEMDKWKKFIRENNLDWINVADPQLHNNFRQDFDIQTTPQLFVLDRDKKIIAKKINAETLEKILEREFEKNHKP